MRADVFKHWTPVIFFGIAIFFSLFHLTESPSVWYDEGIYIQAAANLATSGHMSMQLAPGVYSSAAHITVGYPLIYPLALVFKMFGISVLSARVLMAAFLLTLVVAGYVLVRRLFGEGSALAATLLLVTFPPLYGDGKSVLGEVPGLVFFVLALLSFGRAQLVRRPHLFILTGLFVGLSVATKPLFLLVIPALLVALALGRYTFQVSLREFSMTAVAALIPIVLWFLTQFGGTESVSSMIAYYANPYGIESLRSTIVQNALHLFTSATPLYLSLMLAAWIIALVVRRRRNEYVALEEYAAITFAVLVVCAFLRTAGWYRYLFEAQILATLFFPYALKVALETAQSFLPDMARIKRAIYGLIMLVLAAFGSYGLLFSSWVADSYASDKTAFWEQYFASAPENQTFFFYNTPEVAIFSPGHPYYQYLIPAGGAIGTDSLNALRGGVPDLVIMETDAITSAGTDLTHYVPVQVAYKYTILARTLR